MLVHILASEELQDEIALIAAKDVRSQSEQRLYDLYWGLDAFAYQVEWAAYYPDDSAEQKEALEKAAKSFELLIRQFKEVNHE